VSGRKRVTATIYEDRICIYVEDGLGERLVMGRYSKVLYEGGRIEASFTDGGGTTIELGDVRVWFVRSYDDFIDKCIGVDKLLKRKPEER